MPAWREVQLLVARELGERLDDAQPLTPVRQSRMTWAARTQRTGPIVVKVRLGDGADGLRGERAVRRLGRGVADAPRGAAAAGPLCARLRRWLEPAWGLRLPPVDYAHDDLNLSNILTDGTRIAGVVDWDEFGLGGRALDLIALAFDCERGGDHAAADRLLARAAAVAGDDGLRCLVSYRAISGLAHYARERQAYGSSLGDAGCAAISAILDRLQG
jgi:aminoglycoside phosphotransferase (APT) family kinase protein